jgi:hypothetical protein
MVLMGSPDGKGPLGRSRSGIEDSSKTNIKERVWQGVNWISVV